MGTEGGAQGFFFPAERLRGNQVFPSPPDGTAAAENPPVLVWLPIQPEGEKTRYRCTVRDRDGNPVYVCETFGTSAVPDRPLKPGGYFWNVEVPEKGLERGIQRFTVPEDAILFTRPTVEQVWKGLPDCRPRHLFEKKDIPVLLETRREELEVLRRNIEQAFLDGLPERPLFHRDGNAVPYREYFGRFRDFCDRNLTACALGYALLGDEKAGVFAKELFLHICDWNPSGPCSLSDGLWGDEVGLSCARCFPGVFDLLYPLLNEK